MQHGDDLPMNQLTYHLRFIVRDDPRAHRSDETVRARFVCLAGAIMVGISVQGKENVPLRTLDVRQIRRGSGEVEGTRNGEQHGDYTRPCSERPRVISLALDRILAVRMVLRQRRRSPAAFRSKAVPDCWYR